MLQIDQLTLLISGKNLNVNAHLILESIRQRPVVYHRERR